MRSSEQTTIEELVMSSARTYLYGHALAWGSLERGRHTRATERPARRGLLARVRAAAVGRNAVGGKRVTVEAGGCA